MPSYQPSPPPPAALLPGAVLAAHVKKFLMESQKALKASYTKHKEHYAKSSASRKASVPAVISLVGVLRVGMTAARG